MPNVTYLGTTYPCAKALKGADYIHLLDSNGCMIVAFDGIKDFSGFTIDTDWTAPTPEGECYIAVIGDDGVIRKGGHRCCDINVSGAWSTGTSGKTIFPSMGLYELSVHTGEFGYATLLVNWNGQVAKSALYHHQDRDLQELFLGYFQVESSGVINLFRVSNDGSCTILPSTFKYRKLADA